LLVKSIFFVASEFSPVDAQPGISTHNTGKHRVAIVGSVSVLESEKNSGHYMDNNTCQIKGLGERQAKL